MPEVVDPATLIKGGPSLWGPPIETVGKLQASGTADDAYVVDTLTAPENNPYHSFMRFCGFDFFSDGHTAAISTIGGDVWVVSGIDEKLDHLKWKRFATGLFQPLGLKIRNDVVYTVGRDQITALHDLDGDGEADFYENFNNDCQVTANYHEFTLDIQTDSQGNFYYSKGCPWPPDVKSDNQGTMIKVSADGKYFETFCTGLRAPNGSAMDEHDQLYTGDNEGHWTPSSKFEHLKQRQVLRHGPRRPHAQASRRRFEPPVLWLPHNGVDNSSGAMAFAPRETGGKWGPLDGHMVVASYGMSSLFAVMTEEVGTGDDAVEQGAAVKFPLKFDSSVMRARFNGGRAYPKGDGQLYLCGLKGWQTNAGRDGAFQRVRYTGKPWRAPGRVPRRRQRPALHLRRAAGQGQRHRRRQLERGAVELPLDAELRLAGVLGEGPGQGRPRRAGGEGRQALRRRQDRPAPDRRPGAGDADEDPLRHQGRRRQGSKGRRSSARSTKSARPGNLRSLQFGFHHGDHGGHGEEQEKSFIHEGARRDTKGHEGKRREGGLGWNPGRSPPSPCHALFFFLFFVTLRAPSWIKLFGSPSSSVPSVVSVVNLFD